MLRNVIRKLVILCSARSSDPQYRRGEPDSIPLAINDIEQICSASNCGYKGGKGKQPFRRALHWAGLMSPILCLRCWSMLVDFTSDRSAKMVSARLLCLVVEVVAWITLPTVVRGRREWQCVVAGSRAQPVTW
ncbi:hypothetical protein KCP78_23170 [Salmonella enterica subsp. enterica]|nr:hypothetical protein KCP78_23170 [Salmonella enterica subsp. enterica]